jgi:hypothetical protein
VVAHNLAWNLLESGDLERSVAIGQRVLASRERTIGLAHEHTIMTGMNLAAALFDLKKFAEARDLYVRLLVANKQVFGPNHRDTRRIATYLTETRKNLLDFALANDKLARNLDALAMLKAQSNRANLGANANN